MIDISFLITHFQRPSALEALIKSIRTTPFSFKYEIVVSDDCSSKENLLEIKTFNPDQLITSSNNNGLGHNLNKGIKACKGNFIVYVQEDHIVYRDLDRYLKEATRLLNDSAFDMIRLWRSYDFPIMPKADNLTYKIPFFTWKNFKVNCYRYSDRPFVVKSNFFDKFGYYLEVKNVSYSETEYAIRMLKLNVNIGMSNHNYFRENITVNSVAIKKPSLKIKNRTKRMKKLNQYLRAIRQHIEWVAYDKDKRRLLTYPLNKY